MLKKIALVALATVGGAAAANAADIAPVVVAPPIVVSPVPVASSGPILAGYIGGWGGYRFRASNEGDDESSWHLAYGADAAISIPFAGHLSVQLETRYEHYNDIDTYSPLGALVAGGHLSVRNDRFLVGAFAAAARAVQASPNVDTPGATTGWGYIVGGEAQVYLGRATLYGQAGYGNIATDFDVGPEGFIRGWFASIEGRYFITDNFMVAARYGFGRTNCFIDGLCAPAQDAGVFQNAGVSATFRLANLPFAITTGYEFGTYYATEDDDRGVEHTFRIGITIPFGAGTLLENDRRGATLSLPMLPARAAAWAELLD